jgi:hypothetical protein
MQCYESEYRSIFHTQLWLGQCELWCFCTYSHVLVQHTVINLHLYYDSRTAIQRQPARFVGWSCQRLTFNDNTPTPTDTAFMTRCTTFSPLVNSLLCAAVDNSHHPCRYNLTMMLAPITSFFSLLRKIVFPGRKKHAGSSTHDSAPSTTRRKALLLATAITLYMTTIWNKSNQETLNVLNQHTQTINEVNGQPTDVKLALLMTFPNSGTTYTLAMIAQVTGLHTATVLGPEAQRITNSSLVSLYPDEYIGPFWVQHSRNGTDYPKDYVLTKTHCGSMQIQGPLDKFIQLCLKTERRRDPSSTEKSFYYSNYDTKHIKKAIHLMRDPFDNVVARYHYDTSQAAKRKGLEYKPSLEGFHAYCK